jgi:hypothetical protein
LWRFVPLLTPHRPSSAVGSHCSSATFFLLKNLRTLMGMLLKRDRFPPLLSPLAPRDHHIPTCRALWPICFFAPAYFFCLSVFTREVYRGSCSPGSASQYSCALPPVIKSRSRPDSAKCAGAQEHPHCRSKVLKQTSVSSAPAAKSPAPASARRRARQLRGEGEALCRNYAELCGV